MPNSRKKPSSAQGQLPDGFNYEETVAKVEKIIHQIESGELDLATVFAEFQTAVASLQLCENFLQQKQQQMDLSIQTLEERSEDF
jgi:exodeoxyribonuclease VII small subunit